MLPRATRCTVMKFEFHLQLSSLSLDETHTHKHTHIQREREREREREIPNEITRLKSDQAEFLMAQALS